MADDMSISELKIAVNSANNILEMLESGKKLERWQISKIVLASDFLSSVCTNMRADVHLEDSEEENESENESEENESENESEENESEEEDDEDDNEAVDILLVP